MFWLCVSLSERTVPHKLFTPLLTGMVATGVFLSLVLVVLLYKYMQVRPALNHLLQYAICTMMLFNLSKSRAITHRIN